MNQELFSLATLQSVGNSDQPLSFMADKLRRRVILLPEFQREYIWEQKGIDKVVGWIDTVMSRQAIGVVVTYQLTQMYSDIGDSPTFLADGLQRLTATNKFMDNPASYNFGFGTEQARIYCDNFMITVQHRHYKDHLEAMRAFQKLNSGTNLLPGEFYKGELTLDDVGQELYTRIPQIVDKYEDAMLERKWLARKEKREYQIRTTRGSLALFLQYISGTDRMSLWNTMTKMITGKDVVERELSEYIKDNSIDINKSINYFEEFTASHFATIRKIMEDTGNKDKPLSITFSRFLFHLNIWRKNKPRSADLYYQFVYKLMSQYIDREYFISRIVIPNTEPLEIINVKGDELGILKRLCEHFELPDFYSGTARKDRHSMRGYNASHKLPFSRFGDGETFIEPAQINKSRGANPV